MPAQFNASIAITVNKNDHNEVYLQLASFNGNLVQKGEIKIMNLVLTPKETKKLISALQESLNLQMEILKPQGYGKKNTQENTQ